MKLPSLSYHFKSIYLVTPYLTYQISKKTRFLFSVIGDILTDIPYFFKYYAVLCASDDFESEFNLHLAEVIKSTLYMASVYEPKQLKEFILSINKEQTCCLVIPTDVLEYKQSCELITENYSFELAIDDKWSYLFIKQN